MNYSTFINKVTSLLLYDSIEDDEEHSAFMDQHVRTWMTTMQYYVDNFKVKNVNTYKEADVSVVCDGATITLPAELEKLVRVEFIKPDDYPRTIIVTSAGSVGANGTYTLMDGSDAETRPTYEKGDYRITWTGTQWEITLSAAILYFSTDDVVSSDLATTWTQDTGDLPVPTVTRGNACDDTIPMVPTSYDERDELLNRDCKYSGCYKYAIDKRAVEISIYPYPREDYTYGPESIKVTWEGLKSNYNGSDEVPFTEDTIANCAAYLNAQLARKKEDKLANYNSFYKTYLEGRKEIAMAQRNKSWQRA